MRSGQTKIIHFPIKPVCKIANHVLKDTKVLAIPKYEKGRKRE